MNNINRINDIDLITIPQTLTAKECKYLIELASPTLKTSGVVADQKVQEDVRDATGTWLSDYQLPLTHPIRLKINQALKSLSGLDYRHFEYIHIVKYGPGGKYEPHWDWFTEEQGNSYSEANFNEWGNRTSTFLIYLNEDCVGGETAFPNIGKTVTPQTGKSVFWRNLDATGKPLENSLHAGQPVISGEKYILVIWVREKQIHQ